MKALIAEVDNSTFESKLLALDATKETDYALWKIARKKPPTYSQPIRTTSGNWARSDLEKANVLAYHLEKVFQPNEMTDINPAPTEMDGPAIKDFTSKEIIFAINKLNPPPPPRKASGIDFIMVKILQEIPKTLMMLTNSLSQVRSARASTT